MSERKTVKSICSGTSIGAAIEELQRSPEVGYPFGNREAIERCARELALASGLMRGSEANAKLVGEVGVDIAAVVARCSARLLIALECVGPSKGAIR